MLSALAARNDADAWCDLASSPAALARGATVIRLAKGWAMVTPSVDHLLFNRVFGVPIHAMPEVARLYARHGVSNWMMHVAEEDLDEVRQLGSTLAVERFHRPWAKLARTRGPVPECPCDLPIDEARPDDAVAVATLFTNGFDVPPSAVPLVAALVGRPRWEVLVARDGDRVVGLGLAFDGHGGTSLEGGVTAATHRCRGIQGALMAARVGRAFARGSTWVSSETGVAVPGHPTPRGATWSAVACVRWRCGTTWCPAGPAGRTPRADRAPGRTRRCASLVAMHHSVARETTSFTTEPLSSAPC